MQMIRLFLVQKNVCLYRNVEVIDFFSMNKLTLNIGKSVLLIINPGIMDQKCNTILPPGILKYKQYFEYLGIIISDSGVLK